ncbi:kinase-like protein [Rhizoclosmatium globosum]|uniref:Kinase-like protein n=1 Tax=Rhizoclosmatium globosum TaxID=329046 RepID=A0A1Y2CIR8_9FUNG|nr:kinase-like protein [Rhizoclosmatium globosum]|eukprot:ORY46940.1 kinase-like protein [Rhizoclosmatium globosum]
MISLNLLSSLSNLTFGTTSSPVDRKPGKTKAKILVPPELMKQIGDAASRKTEFLYDGLTSEQRAKVAVINAFAHSSIEFLNEYRVVGVVGFGGNGCVVAAEDKRVFQGPVAIKIIYKPRPGRNQEFPGEITNLRELNTVCESRGVLRCLAAWQDWNHFYLVTELFGSDWTAGIPGTNHPNLKFQTLSCGKMRAHSLQFSSGASDLWSWQLAHRRYMRKTQGSQLLPTDPIKHILRQIALALLAIHNAGFFHGDVKLENILLEYPTSTFGGVNKSDFPGVMIADYGHCRRVEEGVLRYGTEEVAPVEFLEGSPFLQDKLDGRRSDVFALGIVLFVLLSERGRFPKVARWRQADVFLDVEGEFPCQFDDCVSVGARSLLNGMCMVDPSRRLDLVGVLEHPWLIGSDL